MRLKTFTAPDMAAALRLIKHDLGPDAVILSTRKVKNAEGNPTLEITAALEHTPHRPQEETISIPTAPKAPPKDLSAFFQQQPPKPATFLEEDTSVQAPQALTEPLAQHALLPEFQTKLTTATQGVIAAGFSPTDALDMVLSKMVAFKTPTELFPRGKAHVLIGPTGAGKTTFLCKLAVSRKKSGASIGLMSLDDLKIAGFEPLNIVGEALGQQAHLIHTQEDLYAAAQSLGQKHYLFIDTPGLNPRKPEEVDILKTRLDELGLPLTVHLVLPAHLNEADMAAMPYAFRKLNPTSLIFTKLDETTRFGPMASVMMAQSLHCGLISESAAVQDPPSELTAPRLASHLTTAPKPIWEVST